MLWAPRASFMKIKIMKTPQMKRCCEYSSELRKILHFLVRPVPNICAREVCDGNNVFCKIYKISLRRTKPEVNLICLPITAARGLVRI